LEPMRPWQAAVKRLIDVILGLIGLMILIPAGLMVAVAITLDSTGPVVYGARRVGRGGREFTMWKFYIRSYAPDRAGR
jgi:lipopolysaccharide/colanic/teichoic acid biosynthesis glycosyltransferase